MMPIIPPIVRCKLNEDEYYELGSTWYRWRTCLTWLCSCTNSISATKQKKRAETEAIDVSTGQAETSKTAVNQG